MIAPGTANRWGAKAEPPVFSIPGGFAVNAHEIAQSAAQPLLAGGYVIESREGRRSPARASSHHAQLNYRLIGRGSFLTFARSFSGRWNIGRQPRSQAIYPNKCGACGRFD